MIIGDLFSGIGGIGLGALQAGCKIAWAIDRSNEACRIYAHNVSENVLIADMKLIDFSKLPEVDCMVIDIPDSDASRVTERDGIYGYDKQLYKFTLEAIEAAEPFLLVISVPLDIIGKRGGLDLAQFTYDLRNVGIKYNLTAHMFNAVDYEVAQIRKQLIIFGVADDAGFVIYPPTPSNKILFAGDVLDVPDEINDKPPIATGDIPAFRLSFIKPGQSAYTASLPNELMLSGGSRNSNRYRRINPDEPAFRIRGAIDYTVCGYHHEHPRMLTNRERLRLFGFPDSFKLFGRSTKVMRLIGKSTPPPLVKKIFSAILDILNSNYNNVVECNFELDTVHDVEEFITAFDPRWVEDSIMEV
jgi:DNA (cytosine-5)-methyltransferase 1